MAVNICASNWLRIDHVCDTQTRIDEYVSILSTPPLSGHRNHGHEQVEHHIRASEREQVEKPIHKHLPLLVIFPIGHVTDHFSDDHSRVILQNPPSGKSDYINASFVDVSRLCPPCLSL